MGGSFPNPTSQLGPAHSDHCEFSLGAKQQQGCVSSLSARTMALCFFLHEYPFRKTAIFVCPPIVYFPKFTNSSSIPTTL